MIRLVVADDHRIVLDGLEQVLRLEPDFDIVQRAVSGEAAVRAVVSHAPDVLLLDLAMPHMSGLDVMRELQRQGVTTRVVLLTAQIDAVALDEALRLGASAVILKETESRLLVECIRAVHAGEEWRDPSRLQPTDGTAGPSEGDAAGRLTAREREIVRMAAGGLRNREIAERLFITEGTVKLHLHNIYQKLDVNGRPELIRFATRAGLG